MISILMVENNQVAQFAHTYYLTPRGFSIDAVATGEDAVEKLRKNFHYQIILLDSGLFDRGRLAVCREVRLHKKYCAIPILAYTTWDQTIDTQYLEAGVNQVLQKPTPLRNLLKILKQYVIHKNC
ncbi:MAG: response regulator [Gammaproteobacteria bacterium]